MIIIWRARTRFSLEQAWFLEVGSKVQKMVCRGWMKTRKNGPPFKVKKKLP
jgi:hypothetical protein